MNAHSFGSSQQALHAGSKVQDLSDWNPLPEAEAPVMLINHPAQYEVIDPSANAYKIGRSVKQGFSEPNSVRYEIESLTQAPEKVGDVALPSDKSHWWQPFRQNSVEWPLMVTIHLNAYGPANPGQLLPEGFYRLRVQALQGTSSNLISYGGPTPWVHFCIGSGGECGKMKTLVNVAKQTQDYLATHGSGRNVTGAVFIKPSKLLPPAGIGSNRRTLPAETQDAKTPQLVIGTRPDQLKILARRPGAPLKVGNPISFGTVEIKNQGAAAHTFAHGSKLILTCLDPDGASITGCSHEKPLGQIGKGQSVKIPLGIRLQASKAGIYSLKLEVKTPESPASRARQGPWVKNITIASVDQPSNFGTIGIRPKQTPEAIDPDQSQRGRIAAAEATSRRSTDQDTARKQRE